MTEVISVRVEGMLHMVLVYVAKVAGEEIDMKGDLQEDMEIQEEDNGQ